MATAFLGLGANLGDRRAALQGAVASLAEAGVRTLASSSVYETDPFGDLPDQPAFLNAALRVETALAPRELLGATQAAERAAGRPEEHVHHGPRELDVDVLLLGDGPQHGPGLIVPHPGILERRFVLIPLLELDLGLALPDGRRLADALARLPLTDDVRRAGPPLRLPKG